MKYLSETTTVVHNLGHAVVHNLSFLSGNNDGRVRNFDTRIRAPCHYFMAWLRTGSGLQGWFTTLSRHFVFLKVSSLPGVSCQQRR
jgi:hypothetical protein